MANCEECKNRIGCENYEPKSTTACESYTEEVRQLKPCHYCGNKDVKMTVHCFGEHILFKIKCGECHSGSNIEIKSGETFELMEKAVERLISVWNRRTDDDKL